MIDAFIHGPDGYAFSVGIAGSSTRACLAIIEQACGSVIDVTCVGSLECRMGKYGGRVDRRKSR